MYQMHTDSHEEETSSIEHDELETTLLLHYNESSRLTDRQSNRSTDRQSNRSKLTWIVYITLLIFILAVVIIVSYTFGNVVSHTINDLNFVSPPINPNFYNGGNLWQESCSSVNASSMMKQRCSCLILSHQSSTCIMQPPLLLTEYFKPLVDYYPTQLTYRPQIDCINGRYLMIDRFRQDGLGMALGSYNALLSMATYHHLQLIEVPFQSTHIEAKYTSTESYHLRRAQLRAFEWEVSRSQWEACPLDSAVRRNELVFPEWNVLDLSWNRSDAARYSQSASSQFNSTLPFLRKHAKNGLTIRISFWNGHQGCVHPTNLIHAVRSAVDPDRILQKIPFFTDYLNHHYIEVHVHLRRGDLGRWNTTIGEWEAGRHSHRMITTNTWKILMAQILSILPWNIVQRLRWTIYTEANHTLSDPVLDVIRQGQISSFVRSLTPDVAMRFDPPPVRYIHDDIEALDGILSFAQGDILILSPSEFGWASCMLNSMAFRIGIPYGRHWHGCPNSMYIRMRYSRVPDRWNHADWIPESVLSSVQHADVENETNLLVRIKDQIRRVDERHRQGLYPHDHQKPDFISPLSHHLLQQLERDVELGFVSSQQDHYKNVVNYVKKHDDGKQYAPSYFAYLLD